MEESGLSSVFFTWWSPPCLAFLESSSCSLPSQTCWFLPSFFLASSGSCGASFFFLTRFRGFRIQSKSLATLAIARVSSSLRGSRAPPDSESIFAILFWGIERIDTRQESQSVLCHHSWQLMRTLFLYIISFVSFVLQCCLLLCLLLLRPFVSTVLHFPARWSSLQVDESMATMPAVARSL